MIIESIKDPSYGHPSIQINFCDKNSVKTGKAIEFFTGEEADKRATCYIGNVGYVSHFGEFSSEKVKELKRAVMDLFKDGYGSSRASQLLTYIKQELAYREALKKEQNK